MRKFPAAAIGLAVFLAGPTLALAASESAKMTGQDQIQTQNQSANQPSQMSSQDQGQNQSQNNQSIRQQVKNNLAQAGFSDIKIMPQSFLVRAKDKSGNPVMMVINPDSVMAVTEYKGQANKPAGNNATRSSNTTGNED